jgi:single-strand DNA-binding protein
MANLNKVMLIGRLTRDPESRTFTNGGKVAKFGFAVNNRRKNQQTGQWEDEPVFLDCEAFNRAEGGRQMADQVEQYLAKGRQIFIEGHLRLDQWTDKEGQKRSKLLIVVDNFQFLEPRPDGMAAGEGGGRPPRAVQTQRRPAAAGSDNFDDPEHEPYEPPAGRGESSEIPF